MSRYQKGKTNLDFTEAIDSEWRWIKRCTERKSVPFSASRWKKGRNREWMFVDVAMFTGQAAVGGGEVELEVTGAGDGGGSLQLGARHRHIAATSSRAR